MFGVGYQVVVSEVVKVTYSEGSYGLLNLPVGRCQRVFR